MIAPKPTKIDILAKELNVGKSIISSWELGICEPKLSNLILIAEFFNDYLAGLEE